MVTLLSLVVLVRTRELTGTFSIRLLKVNLFSALDTAAVELLEQNLQSNDDGTINRWVPGTWYPIAIEEHAIVSRNSFLYVFGELFLSDID